MGQENRPANELETASTALGALCMAARKAALYTGSHPAAAAAFEDARRAFDAALASCQEASLCATGNGLMWNGDLLPERRDGTAELRQRLRQRSIFRVVFRSGLDAADLAALLTVLSTAPMDLDRGGGANRVLEDQGASHVVIERIDYGKYLRESELQWLETITGGAKQTLAPVANLVGVCVTAAGLSAGLPAGLPAGSEREALQAQSGRPSLVDFGLPFLPDGTPHENGQNGAEAAAAEIAPEDYLAFSLANVIQRSGEAAAASAEADLAQWCSQVAGAIRALEATLRARLFRAPVTRSDDAPDYLTEVAKGLDTSEVVNIVMAYPGAVVEEPSRQLDMLLSRLAFNAERRAEVEPLLRVELVGSGMSADSYQNVVGLLIDRVAKHRQSMQVVIPQELQHPSRAHTDSATDGVVRTLLRTLDEQCVRAARRTMLLEMLEMDLQLWEFQDVVGHLQHEAMALAREGDAGQVIEVVGALERQVQPESACPELHRAAATRALRELGTREMAQCLAVAMSQADLEHKQGILGLFGQLGGVCVAVLEDAARNAEDAEVGDYAFLVLARMGPEGDKVLRPLLSGAETGYERRIARVLLQAGGDAARHLGAILDHRDESLRRELARLLSDAAGPDGEAILIRALQDEDRRVRISAIESLGLRRAASATAALSLAAEEGGLRGDALSVRMAAAAALGRVGTPEAAAALERVLHRTSVLFRDNSDTLRCLAARALAQVPLPQARDALQLGLEERRLMVRQACDAALRSWHGLRMEHDGAQAGGRVAMPVAGDWKPQ